MTTEIVFTSFFTPDYAEDAQKLLSSLRGFGLIHDVRCIQPQSDSSDPVAVWLANVRYKPAFMKMILEEHPECTAIVWIDADAIVNHLPEALFNIDADIGVHFKNGTECLSGTVYIANTSVGKNLLSRWVQAMETKPGVWEQKVLGVLLKDMNIRVCELDTSLCKIFDLVEKQDKDREVLPIIEHFQASRRWRRKNRVKKGESTKQRKVRTKVKNDAPVNRNAVRRRRLRRRRRR